MKGKPLDVFRYLDYRKFLGAYYKKKKAESRAFSYRAFSRRCGMRSPNHLKRIVERERNLSADAAIRYTEAIGLEGDAADYFCVLVRFDQAKSQKEKTAAYRRLTEFRGYRRAQRLDASYDRYHSEWYIPAIREMLSLSGFRADAPWIAAQMIPPITPRQATAALRILEELGMLKRNEHGLEQSDQIVSTGAETAGLHIVNYHTAMMKKAVDSMDLVAGERRDISGVTLCLPSSQIPALKARIREFRREIIALEAKAGEGDQVVHLAVQLFPLTESQIVSSTKKDTK